MSIPRIPVLQILWAMFVLSTFCLAGCSGKKENCYQCNKVEENEFQIKFLTVMACSDEEREDYIDDGWDCYGESSVVWESGILGPDVSTRPEPTGISIEVKNP